MTTALRDHLQHIYDAAGDLTNQLVVDEARPEESPLHDRFEWDDEVAGERYRLQQAGELIRSVTIVYKDDPTTGPQKVRAFHSVSRTDGTGYKPIEEIRADPFARKLLLQSAEREWKALKRKYGHLEEFMKLVQKDVA